MKQVKILLGMIFIIFQGLACAAVSKPQIDALVQAFMHKNEVQGLSLAVIDQGQIKLFNYGYANELKKIPTTSHTIYEIASFSKTFTATLAAIAAVQGKLNLTAPFTDYYPELKPNQYLDQITSAMLLSHVSSLPFNFNPAPTTQVQAMADLQQFVPSYPPGSRYQYSNAGIGIMGYVLQTVYEQNYAALLTANVTQPLKMTSTYLNVPPDKLADLALEHDEHNHIISYDPTNDVWFAAASLKSTISDLAHYLYAQMNPASLADSDPVLAKAITLVHQNYYCFANQSGCEQLTWQAHPLSLLNKNLDDSYYYLDAKGNLRFVTQAIRPNPGFAKQKIFIEKTASGYGDSGYMAYIPSQKLGVVILLNKSFATRALSDQRIVLGNAILNSLSGFF